MMDRIEAKVDAILAQLQDIDKRLDRLESGRDLTLREVRSHTQRLSLVEDRIGAALIRAVD